MADFQVSDLLSWHALEGAQDLMITGYQMQPVDSRSGELLKFPPLLEHHVHVGTTLRGKHAGAISTQMLSMNGDLSEYRSASTYDFKPFHIAIHHTQMITMDALIWDVRPQNSTVLKWHYELALRVNTVPASNISMGNKHHNGKAISKWRWPTQILGVDTHGGPVASFYTARMPFTGSMVLPELAHLHFHGVIAREGFLVLGNASALGLTYNMREGCPVTDAAKLLEWRNLLSQLPPNASGSVARGVSDLRVLCHATSVQERVEGVGYDRRTSTECDKDGFHFDESTVVTSFTFDGPSDEDWWYWVLKGGMSETAFTHHTWFLYLHANDGTSSFPSYGEYDYNQCEVGAQVHS